MLRSASDGSLRALLGAAPLAGAPLGTALLATALLAASACGGDGKDGPCTLGSNDGCDDGQVCEEVVGGENACFAPVTIAGRVFDTADDAAIANATVVALDANGGARSNVVRSAADGTYALPVPTRRDAEGVPVADAVTLRVSAAGYQTFPTAPRTALPLQLGDAVASDDGYVLMNAASDVGLVSIGVAGGTIEGTVSGPAELVGGVLVVAEQGGVAVSSAVSGSDGDFVLFNVPNGSTVLAGYRAGVVVAPETVDATGALVDVVLDATTDGVARVSGSVNIVNAAGGSVTSVILAVASTFDEDAARGETPAGLRVANVSNAFTFEGVPPGRYAVLAAFENDDLVRDPDTSIAGTQIVFVDVAAGADVSLDTSFKVTGALAVRSPGADGVDVLGAGDPTFVWADDSSEDGYELVVVDALGDVVHEADVAGVSGSADVSYTWTGAALEPGMIYQFRVKSFRERTGRTYISATEDLRGVFEYQP